MRGNSNMLMPEAQVREEDEAAVVRAVRELGTPRFQAILDKLGWTYKDDMRRLERILQRLKKQGRLVLAHMRWSVPA